MSGDKNKNKLSKGGTRGVVVTEDNFGVPENSVPIKRFTLTNSTNKASVQIINYGATITSIKVPDQTGKLGDVVLGFDNIQGATIGRVANRTKDGKFSLDGKTYSLPINNGPNHLHGGLQGFDKKVWDVTIEEEVGAVVMSYLSRDGEEGYPGSLLVNVRFQWSVACELLITYSATTTAPTPINLTNHSYFNLSSGEGGGGLGGHWIQINADRYTPVDDKLIPTGELASVDGTIYDLRMPQSLGKLLASFPPGPNGYDHNFCVNQRSSTSKDNDDDLMSLVAVVQETGCGRLMLVSSNQPGVQFYTANFFPDKGASVDERIVGKGGTMYKKHDAFCLETQNWPDFINHTNFPNGVLLPGQVHTHRVQFTFLTTPKLA